MSDGDNEGDEPVQPSLLIKALQALTPGFIRKRFALKFGLAVLILAVAIAGIGLAATDQIATETREDVRQEYQSGADSDSETVERWVEQHRLSTRFVSRNTELTAVVSRDVRDALRREQANLSDDVFQMHVVTIDGDEAPTIKSSTDSELNTGTSLAEGPRSWIAQNSSEIQNLQPEDVIIEDTYAVGDERVISFLSPVRGSNTKYLVTELSVSGIAGTLQGEERAEGGFTQVVDSTSEQVLIAERPDQTLSQYATSDAALEPLRAADGLRDQAATAGVRDRIEGNEVIDETYTVGYAPVDGTDWVVLTHAPRSSVFGFVQTVSNFGLFATIAAVLLITLTGTVLGYTTSTSIDRLTAKTEEMRSGNLDVPIKTSREDNIGRLYEAFAEMRDALRKKVNEAESARKEAEKARKQAEASRAEAMEMANYLEEKADQYSETMGKCASGDMTQRMSKDGESESMDRIAEEFNEMLSELEKTVGQLKSYVDEVEAAGIEVEQSAVTVREASEQVAKSTQTIAADAEDQKDRLDTISRTIDEIATDLESLSEEHPDAAIDAQLDRIQDVVTEVTELVELSEEAHHETDTVSAAAEEQAAELNEVSERANDLKRYAQPLRDILERFDTDAEHEFVFSVGPTGTAEHTLSEESDED